MATRPEAITCCRSVSNTLVLTKNQSPLICWMRSCVELNSRRGSIFEDCESIFLSQEGRTGIGAV